MRRKILSVAAAAVVGGTAIYIVPKYLKENTLSEQNLENKSNSFPHQNNESKIDHGNLSAILNKAPVEDITLNGSQKQPIPPISVSQAKQQTSTEKERESRTQASTSSFPTQMKFTKLAQIPYLTNPQQIQNEDYVMIIVDVGYNKKFESQLNSKITKTLQRRSSSKPVSIYRLNTQNKAEMDKFTAKTHVNIREQDIYLLKNPYDTKWISVDFDMFLKYEKIPAIYLSELKIALTTQHLRKYLTKMNPNETCLLFAVDSKLSTFSQNKLVAKYIEMQMGAQSFENVKICLTDQTMLQETGIITKNAKPNGIHFIRKKNEHTYKPPNRYLFPDQPFHVLQSISLQDKSQNFQISKYLSKIETFSSLQMTSPYICSLTIDKNRTSTQQQSQILRVFAQLKNSQRYPAISFVLRYDETQYKGAQEEEFACKRWSVKLVNVENIDRQLALHQIKNIEQRKQIGIEESDWLRDTFQYMYKEPEITVGGLSTFFNRVFDNKHPQYYKSEAKYKLNGVDKITAQNFDRVIFDNGKSHLVFEYSDHCPSCQAVSPVIQYFTEICGKIPEINTQVHALNCDRNRVKGQPYSPYTPNLYFYSRNWKNKHPIRYPLIEYLKHTKLEGIYNLCQITDQLKHIEINTFEQHIRNRMKLAKLDLL